MRSTVFLFVFLAWLALHVLCGIWAEEAAKAKGLGEAGWIVMGFLFGPFTLLALCAMPDIKSQRILRLMAESQGVDLSKSEPPRPKRRPLTQEEQDALKDVMF